MLRGMLHPPTILLPRQRRNLSHPRRAVAFLPHIGHPSQIAKSQLAWHAARSSVDDDAGPMGCRGRLWQHEGKDAREDDGNHASPGLILRSSIPWRFRKMISRTRLSCIFIVASSFSATVDHFSPNAFSLSSWRFSISSRAF